MSKLTDKLAELLERKYRFPTKGDRLLRDSEDWHRGVEFPGARFHGKYIYGQAI